MGRYKCTISASNGFVDFISSIYKYVFFISLVIGVLLMVVLGIGMSISGIGSEEIKTQAKAKIMDILIGLFALAMIPWILKTIAPFFFK
jgi:nitrogen fixation/metabolism regulation signal transduction histidine kinase